MRFTSAILAVLSVGLVPASARSVLVERDQSIITGDDRKIPGDSPLELCDKDHGKDIVHIKKVDLSPNPPKAYVLYSASRGIPHYRRVLTEGGQWRGPCHHSQWNS